MSSPGRRDEDKRQRPSTQTGRQLIRVLADAHRWTKAQRSGTPLGETARRKGHAESYIRTRARLAFLSPRLQLAILNGTHSPQITAKRLMQRTLPLDWSAQAHLFGM
jgi:hypothetical protein